MFDSLAGGYRVKESIVLFGSAAGEWLEPMSIMSSPLGDCPFAHCHSHLVGDMSVDFSSSADGVHDTLEDFAGHTFTHGALMKDILSEEIRESFAGGNR